eukprot:3836307-Alexandrium_andersonii.AAC.1
MKEAAKHLEPFGQSEVLTKLKDDIAKAEADSGEVISVDLARKKWDATQRYEKACRQKVEAAEKL